MAHKTVNLIERDFIGIPLGYKGDVTTDKGHLLTPGQCWNLFD